MTRSLAAVRPILLLVLGILSLALPRTTRAQVHTNCINCGSFRITPDGTVRDEAPNSTGLTAVFQVSNAQNSVNNVTFSCVATG